MTKKLYGCSNLHTLEPHYSRHVAAMTAEGLHSKSDIAAELAFRDKEIARLRSALSRVADAVSFLAGLFLSMDETDARRDKVREAAQRIEDGLGELGEKPTGQL
jgi:hypothetical protein